MIFIDDRFDNSNFELDRPLPKGKSKKGNWINERYIRRNNHDKICWVKSKNLQLLNG